ncbi:hypothetical protein V8B55DRAFT_1546927 [Mucor lusitanicus]|uniref:Uncharacterized protein n=1 Tax=Mucor circinelloides f. lusitanicus TaxID=29924 RepID=A0A8H4B7K7_MUCCL|nr:hypothetical protein FB192DRAFT_1403227 [Mucor lusitanicus]
MTKKSSPQDLTRPSVNIASGASLGRRIGCGEVKPQYQALNHQAIVKHLIRVGHLSIYEIMVLSTSSVVLKKAINPSRWTIEKMSCSRIPVLNVQG